MCWKMWKAPVSLQGCNADMLRAGQVPVQSYTQRPVTQLAVGLVRAGPVLHLKSSKQGRCPSRRLATCTKKQWPAECIPCFWSFGFLNRVRLSFISWTSCLARWMSPAFTQTSKTQLKAIASGFTWACSGITPLMLNPGLVKHSQLLVPNCFCHPCKYK